MNQLIKSGFLDQIFCQSGNIAIDYDFRNPLFSQITDSLSNTGYLFYNNQTGTGYQYSGSKIYETGNPALSYSDGGAIIRGLVSGQFNGSNKYKILGNTNYENWTAFIVFKHEETGVFNKSKVLFSTQDYDYSSSGFCVGINGCNKVFCEHNTPSSGKRIYTLNEELDNKNLVSVSKVNDFIYLGAHQFQDTLNGLTSDSRFQLVDYTPANKMYLGGLGSSGVDYKNFSGTIDSFMFFNLGLGFAERNTFAKSFYCSSFDTGGYVYTTTTFNAVTGIELQSVVVGTGITGYAEVLLGTESVNGGTVNKYGYSGITGFLYETLPVEITGSVTGESQILTLNLKSGVYDYGYALPFANSKIVLASSFDSSYKEVYSFSGTNNDDLNIIPSFDNSISKYTIFPTGTGEFVSLYINGAAQPYVTGYVDSMTGDYIISGTSIYSDSFYDQNDFAVYDIIFGSGSITGLTSSDITSGSKSLSSAFVNNRDIYLNGNKLISGIDYSGVGSNIVINTTGLIDGDVMLLPRHNANLTRYTGYNDDNFDTNIKLFDEQVWVNGLRQIKTLDYQKVADFSLKYSTFYLEPFRDLIYNNDTGFFNV